MNKLFYVYKITNLLNNKVYIGKSKRTRQSRWKEHLRYAKGGKEKYPRFYFALHAAISKYGKVNFLFEEIKSFNNEVESFVFETKLIKELKESGIRLYNLTDGGEGASGKICSKEHKEKLSISNKLSIKRKLTEDLVKLIKQKLILQSLHKDLAIEFNVSVHTIYEISREKKWKHVKVDGFEVVSNRKPRSIFINSKLNENQVKIIRSMLENHTYESIAKQFNVSYRTISNIATNKTWNK